ncbi:MAG: DNRLRE domain-containing protein, partial [Minicystis sp.]
MGKTAQVAGLRRVSVGLAGWVTTTLVSTLALGIFGASGCGDTIDSRGQSEIGGERAALGEARQAASTQMSCVKLGRLGTLKAYDTQLSQEKQLNNFGSSAFAVAGASADGPGLRFRALFKFETTGIPIDATILSATVTLSQSNNGVGSANVYRITAPWNEATVTWASFADAFNPVAFKSFSTGGSTATFDVAPQLQGWVSGMVQNNGFLIEEPGAFQVKLKSQEYVASGSRPSLSACYVVNCAPHFADCNGIVADGCEADLQSPASCGACGSVCAPPHATAACGTGACAIGACDLGWGDCDGNLQNGCETELTTNAACAACGVACSLPNATASCAGGSCTLGGCNAGSFDCNGNPADGCEATPCADGSHCGGNGDCSSQVCVGGFCLSPACNDHSKNGSETAVDCGGGCPPCASGVGCLV